MASFDQGYKDERFESEVDENFHCPICFNVLNEPVMCRRNQHYFCTPCITRHLQNSNMCPSCREELSVETLNEAPRIVTNYLSNLKIHCDYYERGCTEVVQLGNLKRHVENCGFAPVLCSNEGCLAEINKRDKTHHEAEICEFRKLKCHDCAQLRREIEEVKVNVQEQLTEMKESQIEMERRIIKQIEKESDQMRAMQEEIIKHVTHVSVKMVEMKDEMKKTVQGLSHLNREQDIVIAGGSSRGRLSSVETFMWSNMSWKPLNRMINARSHASSVVYENQIFLAGGYIGTNFMASDSMETLIISQIPRQWSNFPAKLPSKCHSFKSVVYKDRLITTGGWDADRRHCSDSISQVLLVPPFAGRLLTKMPQRRCCHGVELLHDKILIVGGRSSWCPEDALDSVLIYDINTNECKQMAPLPFAVSDIATVSSRDSMFVIGGKSKNDEVLNTVVMYDVNTGESKLLPEMKYPRAGCSAVITGNTVVVMGGYVEGGKELCSVECFELGKFEWKELPPMKQARKWATAVVIPA